MNAFQKLRLAAQCALEWERENYVQLTPEQAWELGYETEGDVLFLNENDNFSAVAIASVEEPHLVEISYHNIREHVLFTLNIETGEIQNA